MSLFIPTLQEWAPDKPYSLQSLRDEGGVLTISLETSEGRAVYVRFTSHLAYRKSDEGDALVTLDEISATSVLGRSFYRVEESDFATWFENRSHGVRRSSNVVHTAILTMDDVIDVLSLDPPVIER
jgi:hypothetical protein